MRPFSTTAALPRKPGQASPASAQSGLQQRGARIRKSLRKSRPNAHPGSGPIILAVALAWLTGCGGSSDAPNTPRPPDRAEYREVFEFSSSTDGWVAGFSDYNPQAQDIVADTEAGHALLPDYLGAGGAFRLSGMNRSDDLFMFIKRRLTGLVPRARYILRARIILASNAPAGAVGSGGPPGEGVAVKFGAVGFEPLPIMEGPSSIVMNIDKGHQGQSGVHGKVVGDMAVQTPIANPRFVLKTIERADVTIEAQADAQGDIWVIVGTDSAFESRSTVYYDQIAVAIEPAPAGG